MIIHGIPIESVEKVCYSNARHRKYSGQQYQNDKYARRTTGRLDEMPSNILQFSGGPIDWFSMACVMERFSLILQAKDILLQKSKCIIIAKQLQLYFPLF